MARATDYTIAIKPKAVPVMDSFTIIGMTGTRQFEYRAYPTPALTQTVPIRTNPLIDPFSIIPVQEG